MESEKLLRFLDNQLKISFYDDSSVNGLQIQVKKYINKICFSVDADLFSIEEAIKKKADLLIVHHGILWKENKPITDSLYEKVKLLVTNNIGLYAIHLPLDVHEEFGNNIQLVKLLGMSNVRKFGLINNIYIGYTGEINMNIEKLFLIVKEKINKSARLFKFGKDFVKTLAVVSGSGNNLLIDVDCFLTGELNYHNLLLAKEKGINVIIAGHYSTERFGLISLMKKISNLFNVECEFIDRGEDFV